MALELFNGTSEGPEDVDVGGLSGQDGGERDVTGLAVESGAAEAGAGKEVRDGLHSSISRYTVGHGHC